jgi:dTDP-4-dehydrorhamnose reductase
MIWLVGKNGQLSRCLQNQFHKDGKSFISTSSSELDITDKDAIYNFLKKEDISVIINCSAYTAVDKAESEKNEAYAVNQLGVKNLVEAASDCNCYLVHFSTDFVFSGESKQPYTESCQTRPLGIYGASKLAGEIEIINSRISASIFRVSWLYSPYGNNFVKTMVRLGKERDEIGVVSDQIGSPTSALELAKFISDNLKKILSKKGSNIYHFSCKGNISWHEFASEIMINSKNKCRIKPITTLEYPTPAKRPSYSVMSLDKVEKDFSYPIKPWTESLSECLNSTDFVL